jgi:hypothetical protein
LTAIVKGQLSPFRTSSVPNLSPEVTHMSVSLIIALNVGAAMLLAILLTALMLLPKRLPAHRHPHLLAHHETAAAPIERQDRSRGAVTGRQRSRRSGRAITDS